MYYKKVYNTAYFITKDPQLSQDIMQDSFIKAFDKIDSLKDKEKLESWLISITTRTTIDALRKNKLRNHISIEEYNATNPGNSYNSVEYEVESIFLKKELREHLDGLPYDYRVVVLLRYIHEFKIHEISETLSIGEGTVKTRLHRAKKKLKEKLGKSSVLEGGGYE
ncbi:RNA polymerase sigma factor [Evansella sp. AB-P1]|uniref:RNA polymerase sigma factor n=1 Tax=Evansella sp. AB-P1 TaxID=3037653 RepID=UPI00241C4079|nr:RNA polymerase sigma factor [Evansella sp. AB-P1]MDG5790163.1 RNA polymerase sigma factor [Evansella sp. AB-P1]